MADQPTTPATKATPDQLDRYLADLGLTRPALQASRVPVIGLYLVRATLSG